MTEPRFLVVRLGSLGDIVHTFPAVAGLRATFPAAEITWLTHPRWQALIKASGLTSRMRVVDSRNLVSARAAISSIRAETWTAAIDYQGLFKSALLPFLGGVTRRIGFSSHSIREFGVPLLYTDRVRVTSTHVADQNGELSRHTGARSGVASFDLCVSRDDVAAVGSEMREAGVERYIVLSPGGGWRSKCWPADRFGALCRRIRESVNLRCVVNYGPGEDDLVETIRAESGEATPIFFRGELPRLMALLQSAACVVAGDTGPLHLAVALGAPVVAIFGPTNPARNGPYQVPGDAQHTPGADIVLRSPNVTTTHARGSESHPSMLALDVDSVFAAVLRRMGQTS